MHFAWNAAEVERELLACPAVVLAFNGHDHMGGYSCLDGVHFIGLEGMVESPQGRPHDG